MSSEGEGRTLEGKVVMEGRTEGREKKKVLDMY